jgi:predicted AAA+ superfamily ATPase
VLFDEIQNVPELLPYIRTRIDERSRSMGKWLFTGSQVAPLRQGVTESMAGRAAVLQLLPFSLAESQRVTLLCGGYPEVVAQPNRRGLWFSSYVQTYLERDLRAVTAVRDRTTFRRFLKLVASRHGQILNKKDLARRWGCRCPRPVIGCTCWR